MLLLSRNLDQTNTLIRDMTPDRNQSSQTRVLTVLLTFASIFFSVAVAASLYIWINLSDIRAQRQALDTRQLELLSKLDLQRRLLHGGKKQDCAYPHADSRIGFVLNPWKKECNLWTEDEYLYSVNSLGLRGEAISPKSPSKKRVVVLGDSWVWGWRLRDEDRLAALLQKALTAKLGAERYEFLTVAMPGWNVESEYAFLTDHYHILQPDLVIWVITQNDIWDTFSVIPPGKITTAFSSQSQPSAPYFPKNVKDTHQLLPFVRERWEKNIRYMHEVQDTFDVPIVSLAVHMPPPLVKYISSRADFDFPLLLDAPQFQQDRRWGVADNDSHPTRWANESMVPAFLNTLVSEGFLPALDFTRSEQRRIDAWKLWGDVRKSGVASDEYALHLREQATPKIPERSGPAGKEVGFVREMGDWGVIFLQTDPGDSELVGDLSVNEGFLQRNSTLTVQVRDSDGEMNEHQIVLTEPSISFQIPLPETHTGNVIEIQWRFDQFAFNGPNSWNLAVWERLEAM